MTTKQKVEKKYYECFSYKQYKYLIAMGFTPERSDIHKTTGKRFWVYRITAKLQVALKAWSVIKADNYIEK